MTENQVLQTSYADGSCVGSRCWLPGNKRPRSEPMDWIFANPRLGGRLPYNPWNAQQRYIRPIAEAMGLGKGIGWHTFRHTYSSMLRELRVDVKVQQELLRHPDIRTTLNVYTQAVSEDLRQAKSKVVSFVLPARGRIEGGSVPRTGFWRREWDSNAL
jgi:integrase